MSSPTKRDRLYSTIILNVLLAIGLIFLPTVVLFAIIGGRMVEYKDGAVITDVSLGTILVFSSLAAIMAPLIYRPVSVLVATYLAREWVLASAKQGNSANGMLPSTPQYLLAVGNLGIPGLKAFSKSMVYYARRSIRLSPIFIESYYCLGGLLITTFLVVVGDIAIHASSTAILSGGVFSTSGLNNFSRSFAVSENPSNGPLRLQEGLQTFLGASPVSNVTQFDNTVVIVPADLPTDRSVIASTIGMKFSCESINLDCTFNEAAFPPTFDCSGVEPNAHGSASNTNVTFYPSSNSTTFTLIASVALPSLFNMSELTSTPQIFQCSGSLQNVTYSFISNDFSIVSSNPINFAPLSALWNLTEFSGKQTFINNVVQTVGMTTIATPGVDPNTLSMVFTNALSRFFMSFLAGQTTPTQSLMESKMSNHIVSRVPLAAIIYLAIVVSFAVLAISIIGFRALYAVIYPPSLQGDTVSITNLHHQLTSPIDVLKSVIGSGPLEMRVLFNGQDSSRSDIDRRTTIGSDATHSGRQDSVYDPNTQIAREPVEQVEPLGQAETDEMSVEEARAFIGMDQRRAAAEQRDEIPEIRVEYPLPRGPRNSWGHQDYIPVQLDYDS